MGRNLEQGSPPSRWWDGSIGRHRRRRWHRRACEWKRGGRTRQDAGPLADGVFTVGVAFRVGVTLTVGIAFAPGAAFTSRNALPLLSTRCGHRNAFVDAGCPRLVLRGLRGPRYILDRASGIGNSARSMRMPPVYRRRRERTIVRGNR